MAIFTQTDDSVIINLHSLLGVSKEAGVEIGEKAQDEWSRLLFHQFRPADHGRSLIVSMGRSLCLLVLGISQLQYDVWR